MSAPFVLEFFGCSGGLAEGLRRVGLCPTMSFDWDSDACESYERNLGSRLIQMDVRELLRAARAGWRPTERIDLLVADPPCARWSRGRSRLGTYDERDLVDETVEFVRLLRPRAYLIANVPGLDDGPNWHVVQRTIGELARVGYCVRDFAQLDAADYGVPQHRVRPFWYGHLDGPCIAWPERTHGSPAECATLPLPGTGSLRPWVTCRDALGHLSPEELGRLVRLRSRASTLQASGDNITGTAQEAWGVLLATTGARAGEPQGTPTQAKGVLRDGALLLDAPSFMTTSKGHGRDAQGACVLEWPWDAPATTVPTTDRLIPTCHHQTSILSVANAIKLSERAAAILQGFAEGWQFVGTTKRSRWAQIGMAVPPPLGEAVGRSILVALRSALRRGSSSARRRTSGSEARP
jgi:site-specific DNA-cytosine methylase